MRIRAGSSKGFTLMELLVVVAIIVILIAILLPALEKAMIVANKAVCLTNLKAFSTAYKQYSMDYKGDSICAPIGSRVSWQYALSTYLGYPNMKNEATVGAKPFMLCPQTSVTLSGGFAPDAHTTWDSDSGQGSYGLNLFLMSYICANPNLGYPASWWHLKYDSAAGQTPVVGDSWWIGGWPTEDDPDPSNYDPGTRDGGGAYMQMDRWAIDRHGGNTVNLSFVDGSARNMILGELWNVPWHRKFNPSYKNGGWDNP